MNLVDLVEGVILIAAAELVASTTVPPYPTPPAHVGMAAHRLLRDHHDILRRAFAREGWWAFEMRPMEG